MKLVKHPDPSLDVICKPVVKVDGVLPKEVVDLGMGMIKLMYETNGVGLAATQVGSDLRVLVMDCTQDKSMPVILVNPVLVESSKETLTLPEGCLSFPGLFYPITRPARVTIRAINMAGVDIEAKLDGLWARCFLHELDHLDGVVFTSLASGEALSPM